MDEKFGSFSFDVAKRILDTLYENGPLKKTNLATKTGLNYNSCLRYIDMLGALGWLDFSLDISLTELGDNVRRMLSNPKKRSTEEAISEEHPKYLKTTSASMPRNDLAQNVPAPLSSLPQENASSVRIQNRDKMIMIVDDESDVAFTYRSFLSEKYNVQAFSVPYEALRSFASMPHAYELVILDIRMPDINGLQLYQSLKVMNPYCKFLFVSSLDAAKELLSILPGIQQKDILRKPVRRERFLRVIDDIMDI